MIRVLSPFSYMLKAGLEIHKNVKVSGNYELNTPHSSALTSQDLYLLCLNEIWESHNKYQECICNKRLCIFWRHIQPPIAGLKQPLSWSLLSFFERILLTRPQCYTPQEYTHNLSISDVKWHDALSCWARE